jgi:predicted flap endonuclease-1-like 5' DNA nuclease
MSNETQQATAPAAPIKAVPEATQANTEAVATPAPEAVADAQVTEDSVAATEAGLAALSIGQAEMHLACAEGRLEDVRAILGRGLESLETLGKW